MPECRNFALFELEGGVVVGSTRVVHTSASTTTERAVFENELNWNLGAMRNVSREWALGGAVSLGTGSPTPLTGIRVRARRWLAQPFSAEIEAGAVDTGLNDRFGSGTGWGPTVGGRLNMGDYFSVFTRWEGAYAQSGSDADYEREAGFHQGVYVGASAGSTAAVAGSGVIGLLVLFVVYSLSNTDF